MDILWAVLRPAGNAVCQPARAAQRNASCKPDRATPEQRGLQTDRATQRSASCKPERPPGMQRLPPCRKFHRKKDSTPRTNSLAKSNPLAS